MTKPYQEATQITTSAGWTAASGLAFYATTDGDGTPGDAGVTDAAFDDRYAPRLPVATTVSGTTHTVVEANVNRTVICSNAALVTVTIPTGTAGWRLMLFASGAGGVTLTTTGLTLVGSSPNKTIAQNEGIYVEWTAASTVMLVGGTAA